MRLAGFNAKKRCHRPGYGTGGKTSVFLLLASLAMLSGVIMAHKEHKAEGSVARNFSHHFYTTSDASHYRVSDDGGLAQLVLDQESASGFASKTRYLFGRISIQMKLHPGDSAGTVTTFYMSSLSGKHDELDFEFLGNETGKPYVLQTNVYAGGVGDREQRINLWFDPTTEFHTYSLHWNKHLIIFLIDNTPIRLYRNNEDLGVPYPNRQPMTVFASLWNGDQWATQFGAVKLNWSNVPFVASYQGYAAHGCEVTWYSGDIASCISRHSEKLLKRATLQSLDSEQLAGLQWVAENMLIYDYCADRNRYPKPHPECSQNAAQLRSGPTHGPQRVSSSR